MNTCKKCTVNLTKKWSKIFCSRSCSASYTNTNPKRIKRVNSCLSCSHPTKNCSKKFCVSCISLGWPNTWPHKPFLQRTLAEEVKLNPGKGANRYNRIRGMLRHSYKNVKELSCQNCNYTPHVELCHIKPIASFPSDTLLSEINDKNNIAALCPNCHWEFDNGILKLCN